MSNRLEVLVRLAHLAARDHELAMTAVAALSEHVTLEQLEYVVDLVHELERAQGGRSASRTLGLVVERFGPTPRP